MFARIIVFVALALLLGVASISAEERAPALIEKAQALLKKEEFLSAKPLLEKALAQQRSRDSVEYATVLALLGRVQAETNQAAVAITNINRALVILRGRGAPEAAIASADYALARA